MAKFNGYVITEQGRDLIAKGLAGGSITFTKMQLGDGTTTNDGRTMTALVSPKSDLPIININFNKTGICDLGALISNKDMTAGFYIKELGIFAKGDDGVEILYAYNVSPNPAFIPPFSSNNVVEIEYIDSIIVDQVSNVTALIDPSITYVTKQYADKTYVSKESMEGLYLCRILGIDDLYYGGLISATGLKTKGKAYYDSNTKQIYLCRENNNLNYVDLNKFTAFSNKSLLDKLENLFKVSEIVEVPNSVFSAVKFWRYGNRAFLFVFFDYKNSKEVNWMTEGVTLTNYPANFTPDTPFLDTEHVILSNNNLNKNIARLVLRNDKITIHGVEGMTHYELKGIISYMTK